MEKQGFVDKKQARAPVSAVSSFDTSDGLPWTIAWCLVAVLFLALVWYPVSRISAHYPFFSNEGFNTHFAASVAAGEKTVDGLAIGIPGPLDPRRGIVYAAPALKGWDQSRPTVPPRIHQARRAPVVPSRLTRTCAGSARPACRA